MIQIRKSEDRGRLKIDWLEARHTFSFGNYYDPKHNHFEHLRVLNEDKISAGGGFDTHPHENMEIFTFIISGELKHQDSMGNGAVIKAGDIQYMAAGSGVYHSEFNPSSNETCHLLQMWVIPNKKDVAPRYEQTRYSLEEKRGKFICFASDDGRNGSFKINRNATISVSYLTDKDICVYRLEGKAIWVQVARGSVVLNGQMLNQGDGASAKDCSEVVFEQAKEADLILFDFK